MVIITELLAKYLVKVMVEGTGNVD